MKINLQQRSSPLGHLEGGIVGRGLPETGGATLVVLAPSEVWAPAVFAPFAAPEPLLVFASPAVLELPVPPAVLGLGASLALRRWDGGGGGGLVGLGGGRLVGLGGGGIFLSGVSTDLSEAGVLASPFFATSAGLELGASLALRRWDGGGGGGLVGLGGGRLVGLGGGGMFLSGVLAGPTEMSPPC